MSKQSVIKEVYELDFDPAQSDVADIFTRREAWVFWCAVKSQHIVSQHFDDSVRHVASLFLAINPKDGKQMARLLDDGHVKDPAVRSPWFESKRLFRQIKVGRYETDDEMKQRRDILDAEWYGKLEQLRQAMAGEMPCRFIVKER